MNPRLSRNAVVLAVLIGASFNGTVFAQAASAVITKSFTPATVPIGGNSIATITVTNPNGVPLTNVQFSDVMQLVSSEDARRVQRMRQLSSL